MPFFPTNNEDRIPATLSKAHVRHHTQPSDSMGGLPWEEDLAEHCAKLNTSTQGAHGNKSI